MTDALAHIDAAISDCANYVSRHATDKHKYGWGWCAEAATVAKLLAEAREIVTRWEPITKEDENAVDAGESIVPGLQTDSTGGTA